MIIRITHYLRSSDIFSKILVLVVILTGCGNEQKSESQATNSTASEKSGESTYVLNINSVDEFDRLMAENDIVLADFYADWCGPCHMLKPKIKEIALEYDGQMKVVSVDIDKFSSLANRYKVNAIPDVKIFKNAQLEDSFIGVQPKENYTKALDRLIKN